MIKENLNIKWTVPEGFIRADKVSQDLLRLAKQAGCVDFWFAMESGSQRVLDNIINKKTSIEQIKETAQIAKKKALKQVLLYVLAILVRLKKKYLHLLIWLVV